MSGLGWIKLHRSIKDNWVFTNAEYFKAWVTILMEVNHSNQTVLINSKLVECNRGESVKSLDTWAGIFGKNWNKSKVRRFFKLLESGLMIVTKNISISTHLTVCNYTTYQDECNADETEVKRKRNGSDTEVTPNNNGKNGKNVKRGMNKDVYLKSLSDFRVVWCKSEDGIKWMDSLFEEYPLYDIKRMLSNAYDYWSTDKGYGRKLKEKSKTIDWKATFKNGMNMDFNVVLK